MIALVEDNREAIAERRSEYGVLSLVVFGAAVAGTIDPETSDVDFVADLAGNERGVAGR